MNQSQALTEARKRWGKHALIESCKPRHDGLIKRCRVGRRALGVFFEILGQGDTWAEAFEDADRRKQEDHVRYQKIRAIADADEQPCPRCSRTMTERRQRLTPRQLALLKRLRELLKEDRKVDRTAERNEYIRLRTPHRPTIVTDGGKPDGFDVVCFTCAIAGAPAVEVA